MYTTLWWMGETGLECPVFALMCKNCSGWEIKGYITFMFIFGVYNQVGNEYPSTWKNIQVPNTKICTLVLG